MDRFVPRPSLRDGHRMTLYGWGNPRYFPRLPPATLRYFDVEPDAPSVQLLAGRAYLQSAQLRRAEQAFLRVLEQNPSDHYARFALGRTLQRQSRLEEARAQLAMAVAMNPTPDYQEALNEVRMRIASR